MCRLPLPSSIDHHFQRVADGGAGSNAAAAAAERVTGEVVLCSFDVSSGSSLDGIADLQPVVVAV